MTYFLFALGVLFGSIATQIIFRHKAAYGRFSLSQTDTSPECLKVTISIADGQNLLKKDKIILHRTKTQE